MDDNALRQIAGQLRQPQGEAGVEVGRRMNVGNEIINRRAIAQLAVQPGDRILELGPGNGFFVGDIVSTDPTVRYVGCDFSEVMIEQANQLNAPFVASGQAVFVQRTEQILPFAENAFNKIVTINTLYFWDDPAAELAECRRVLEPGGQLIIGIRPRWIMEQMPFVAYGFQLYTPQQAADLVATHGFQLTALIVEPEPDQLFFGEALPMETVLVCGQRT